MTVLVPHAAATRRRDPRRSGDRSRHPRAIAPRRRALEPCCSAALRAVLAEVRGCSRRIGPRGTLLDVGTGLGRHPRRCARTGADAGRRAGRRSASTSAESLRRARPRATLDGSRAPTRSPFPSPIAASTSSSARRCCIISRTTRCRACSSRAGSRRARARDRERPAAQLDRRGGFWLVSFPLALSSRDAARRRRLRAARLHRGASSRATCSRPTGVDATVRRHLGCRLTAALGAPARHDDDAAVHSSSARCPPERRMTTVDEQLVRAPLARHLRPRGRRRAMAGASPALPVRALPRAAQRRRRDRRDVAPTGRSASFDWPTWWTSQMSVTPPMDR